MVDNPIEIEYKLKIILSQRDKPIIIQDNKYIFYYSHKRKDESKIFRCSMNRNKQICFAYVILDKNNKFNQIDFNLSHTEHDDKLNEVQSLKGINIMKDIIKKTNDKFTIKSTTINIQIANQIAYVNPKYLKRQK